MHDPLEATQTHHTLPGSHLALICYTCENAGKLVLMELVAHPLLAFLTDPLRRHPRAFDLGPTGITAKGGARNRISFDDIASKPTTRRRLLSSSLALHLSDGANILLPAVQGSKARAFAEAVETAWSQFNLEQLNREEDSIRHLLKALEGLKTPVSP